MGPDADTEAPRVKAPDIDGVTLTEQLLTAGIGGHRVLPINLPIKLFSGTDMVHK